MTPYETKQLQTNFCFFVDKKKALYLKPTQAILSDSDNDEIEDDEENSVAISPVFESNRTRSPSPVFQSQSLLQTKRVRRTLWETNSATR